MGAFVQEQIRTVAYAARKYLIYFIRNEES